MDCYETSDMPRYAIKEVTVKSKVQSYKMFIDIFENNFFILIYMMDCSNIVV